jgi:serine/threonine protein phosphatase 1
LRWRASRSPAKRMKPRIAYNTRIYAIGDVHWRADLLHEMFSAIDDSPIRHPIQNAVQVLMGDYIDRGPDSREVIEALIRRARRHTMIYPKGNHESYAMQFLTDPTLLAEWQKAGGANTLLSYGPKHANGTDPAKVATAFREAMPKEHLRFLSGLALSFTCGDFFFAHAGVRPGIPLAKQTEHDLLWIRDEFLLHEDDFDKIIVHGHTPSEEPEVRSNRINIDTGAYATGRLTCLILQGDQMVVI